MTNEELVQRITAGDESHIAELWGQNEKFCKLFFCGRNAS